MSTQPKRGKITFYLPQEDADRARAALINTQHLEGMRSMSDLVHQALSEKVEELENRYNDGKPWPPAPSGSIPRGRAYGT